MDKTERALREAIKQAGGVRALARQLEITAPAIIAWREVGVPVRRVLAIEKLTGVSRHDLRPDIYPREDWEPKPVEAKTLFAYARPVREKKREKV